jgi:D-tyrosyl-tRNA(Tyr) deacylase
VRLVVQRVSEARVLVAGEVIASIGRGMLLLVGLATGDDEVALGWMARKIAGLRMFAVGDAAFAASLDDIGGQVLAVSQFTLLADCRKGRRPSFSAAMPPDRAEPLFARFVQLLVDEVGPVATGRFGATMQVVLANDGPVTLILDR